MTATFSRAMFLSALFLSCISLNAGSSASPKSPPIGVHVDNASSHDVGSRAVDGDPRTFWHTPWDDKQTDHPHEITLDLRRDYEIAGFTYLPRQDGSNGRIKDYEFYVADDPTKFGEPAAKGTFPNDSQSRKISLAKKIEGRYVRLRALNEHAQDRPWTTVAELNIHAEGLAATPDAVIDWDGESITEPVPEWQPREGQWTVTASAEQESLGFEAYRAMDGDANTIWRTPWHTERRRHPHRITFDLSESIEVRQFRYRPPRGGGNGAIADYEIFVHENENDLGQPVARGTFDETDREKVVSLEKTVWGRYVTLVAKSSVYKQPWVSIAEFRIDAERLTFVAEEPSAERKAELATIARRGIKPPHRDSLEDNLDLALRTAAMVQRAGGRPREINDLRNLEKSIGQGGDKRRHIENLNRLRRRIILAHPALDFRRILIAKRPPPGYSHMCDQYLGRHSRPGPGLAIVDNWKDSPRCREILSGKLPTGSVLHPDLSFDGRRVLFSFCDHTETDTKRRRFLIYEADVNGGWVKQLTGSEKDPMHGWEGRKTVLIEDFDPCYLPEGGFVFISTRSQTFGRCHGSRYVPTYMVFRADADGANIRQLSFGEANEWDPAVMHNGRLVYTRWDYINRHDTRFQSLWTMAPDGTTTSHFFGNYSSSPCMTAESKPVPDSHQIACTAMAHHGYSNGSVILVDPRRGQDGEEPITRITPEIRYPEAGDRYGGGGEGVFATPFPLSEELFLMSYTTDRATGQGGVREANAYGIYLVDNQGGRELIYRDDSVSCFSPIPVRSRPRPEIVPSHIAGRESETTGVFFIQDIYRSSQEIEPRSIKSVRVNRIYGQPTNGKPNLSLANNEIIKGVLGTVPVNSDGSAAFRAPAGLPLQLQALDENGMAVMTMRSLVYLQPGETAACVGCHEHRGSTPIPAAMPRNMLIHEIIPPAGPQYEGGFSYARTVQPVLDRYCIECHGLKKRDAGLDLLGVREDRYNRSHNQLTGRDGWVKIAYRNGETAYSAPKDYFSHAGKLAEFLLHDHQHRVKLDRDSFQRIVDWLDLNAQYYGDYSRNRVEDRRIHAEHEKALREHIEKTFGADLARQPIEALVNVAEPSESRILKAPLSTRAGGWGQIGRGWGSTNDAGFKEMRQLVEACIQPHDSFDIAGTCGRTGCGCGACWTRKIREEMQHPPVDRQFERLPTRHVHEMDEIPRDRWRVVRVDSEETQAIDGVGIHAIDGDETTYWMTDTRSSDAAGHPHEIVIDLGAEVDLCGLRIMPRRGLGDPRDCEIFVTSDPEKPGSPVRRGYCDNNTRSDQAITFEPRHGRYVCLRILSGQHGSPYAAIRELHVYAPKPESAE
jgi:hypothetical protein